MKRRRQSLRPYAISVTGVQSENYACRDAHRPAGSSAGPGLRLRHLPQRRPEGALQSAPWRLPSLSGGEDQQAEIRAANGGQAEENQADGWTGRVQAEEGRAAGADEQEPQEGEWASGGG